MLQVLWVDVHSGLRTLRTDLTMDRGLSFEVAKAKAARESMPSDRSGFRRSRQPMFGRSMYILALQKPGQPNLFSICRPNTGVSYFDMEVCCSLPSCSAGFLFSGGIFLGMALVCILALSRSGQRNWPLRKWHLLR